MLIHASIRSVNLVCIVMVWPDWRFRGEDRYQRASSKPGDTVQ